MAVPKATDVRFSIFASLSSVDLTLKTAVIHQGHHLREREKQINFNTCLFFLFKLYYCNYYFLCYVATASYLDIISQVVTNGEQVKNHTIDCAQCVKMHSIDVCEKKHQSLKLCEIRSVFLITLIIYFPSVVWSLISGKWLGVINGCHKSNISSWRTFLTWAMAQWQEKQPFQS